MTWQDPGLMPEFWLIKRSGGRISGFWQIVAYIT